VTPAALTIAANNTNKVYGAAVPALGASYSGFVNGDTTNSLTTRASLSTTATSASPAGSYPIAASGAAGTNYSIGYVAGTLTVTPAALTIAANNTNKVYGAAVPALGASYSGFVNGDTTNSLTTQASLSTTATATSTVGAYPIAASGAAGSNYTIGYVAGTLLITKARPTGYLTSSKNPVPPDQTVVFTLGLSVELPGAGTPTGSTTFKVDGLVVETSNLSTGSATFSTATLAVGTHTVEAQYSGSADFLGATVSLSPVQLINTPPVAGADTLGRSPAAGTKVALATLLANDYDADGDPIVLITLDTNSTYGGVLSQSNGWVYYTPPVGFTNDDAFAYTIGDGRGASATGTVSVLVFSDILPSPNLAIVGLGDGAYLVQFDGIPGATYRIEYTETMAVPDWQLVGEALADDAGQFQFIDRPPSGQPGRFYRSVSP
jgi:hypothetical protein